MVPVATGRFPAIRGVQTAYDARRVAGNNGKSIWEAFRNHRAGPDRGEVPQRDTRQHHRPRPNPVAPADGYPAGFVARQVGDRMIF